MNTATPPQGGSVSRSEELYEKHVRGRVRPEDFDKFLAIDFETGRYEIDADLDAAVARLRVGRPRAQLLLMRGDGRPAFPYSGPPARPAPPNREDIVPLGEAVFETHIRPTLRPEDHGKFIAIDVDTGRYEMDASPDAVLDRLHAGREGVRGFLMRAGYPTAFRMRRRPGAAR